MLIEYIIFILLFISHLIFLGIAINNFFFAPRIKNVDVDLNDSPKISILIPARNEEKNIARLLDAIIKQTYENYEVIVLDDHSTDQTFAEVSKFSEKNDKINVVKGSNLPEGWLGKNWACYQLSQMANEKLFLFIDADVTIAPKTLSYSLNIFLKNNLQMLSCFPTQKIKTFGEWLVVPLMNWLLLTFLPLNKVYTSLNESYTAANGQFILIDKDSYLKIGTHKAVKGNVVEDMEVARLIKSKGEKIMTTVGDDGVFCTMYNSFSDSFNGFSKNFFPGFNMSKFLFLILITVFLFLFLAPIFFSFINFLFLIIVVLILLERLFISLISKQNWVINLVLHPIQIVIMLMVGINSTFSKRKLWKGRKIA